MLQKEAQVSTLLEFGRLNINPWRFWILRRLKKLKFSWLLFKFFCFFWSCFKAVSLILCSDLICFCYLKNHVKNLIKVWKSAECELSKRWKLQTLISGFSSPASLLNIVKSSVTCINILEELTESWRRNYNKCHNHSSTRKCGKVGKT